MAGARLTNNSDETFAQNLLKNDTYFAIPFFQRPYKWKKAKIDKFLQDILTIVDKKESHFLGAAIFSEENTTPSEPNKYFVIDGQQRLTTIFLFICAAVKVLAQNGRVEQSSRYMTKYIVSQTTSGNSNILLQPSLKDRAQLNEVLHDIYKVKPLSEILAAAHPLKKISSPTGSPESGTLTSNYKTFGRWFKHQKKENGDDIKFIEEILDSALSYLSIVQIVVKDPTTGPTIYNSLNSSQEPMTIGELVKNGIFSKAASKPADEIERLEEHSWRPFFDKFTVNKTSFFDSYFFPFGLTKDHNVKKQDTFSTLLKEWNEITDPIAIIEDLSRHQDTFLDIVCGTTYLELNKELKTRIKRFYEMGSPSSLLPFIMELIDEVKQKKVSEKVATEILDLVESFLVRRATCGIEPTGLHAVFKRLWIDIKGDVSASQVEKVIRDHGTVQWPNEKEFEANIKNRKLYGTSICPYILSELDRHLGGDKPADKATIEHVLPQNPEPSSKWVNNFTSDQRKEMQDTLSNLILLSVVGQNKVKNKDYSIKREEYKSSSMYKITRSFGDTYEHWTPSELEERRKEIVNWALKRWPS